MEHLGKYFTSLFVAIDLIKYLVFYCKIINLIAYWDIGSEYLQLEKIATGRKVLCLPLKQPNLMWCRILCEIYIPFMWEIQFSKHFHERVVSLNSMTC